jgi:hypothetical protein
VNAQRRWLLLLLLLLSPLAIISNVEASFEGRMLDEALSA